MPSASSASVATCTVSRTRIDQSEHRPDRSGNRLEQSLRPEPSAKPVPTREWRWKERGAGTNEPGRSRCDQRLENEAIDAAARPWEGVEKRLRHTHRKISFLWKSVENLGGKRWEKRPVDR